MNKNIKRFLCAFMVLALMFCCNMPVLAQGTTSISVSGDSLGVGDSTTVSISASSSGTVTVKYTASILSLSDCTASGYSSEGNTVTFSGSSADIVFSAVDEGTASIIVSSSSCAGSSTTITVAGTGSADESSTETAESSEETTDSTSQTTSATAVGYLNTDGGFDIEGISYVVSERFTDSEIPSGFSKVSLTIGNGTYNELSDGTTTLIYLKPADNTEGSGEFYKYDADAGSVTKYVILKGNSFSVVIQTPDSTPSSIYSATLSLESGNYDAYTLDGSEFYYVYGNGSDGNTGWYMYDTTTANLSRADVTLLNSTVSTETEETEEDSTSTYDATMVLKSKLAKLRKIISFLIILCVILVFYIINFIVKKRTSDDDIDDGDVFAKAPSKNTGKMPRSIVFKDEDDDEDDDEEDEDSDDSHNHKNGSGTGSGQGGSGLNMMDLNDL